MIRLFCSDFDGTLGRHGKISTRNVEAIRALQRSGIDFALVTGRPLANACQILEQYQLQADIVASNGAVVFGRGKVISSQVLDSQAFQELVDFAEARHLFYIAYEMDRCLLPHWVPIRSEGFLAKKVQSVSGIRPYRYPSGEASQWGITKMNLYPRGKSSAREVARWEKDERMYLTTSSSNKFEISAAGVSKWNGIQTLAAQRGIPFEEIAAIGDYQNDVPMLQNAAESFAMGNAIDEVKRCAKHTVSSVAEDGVAEAIELVIRENVKGKACDGPV